MFRYDKKRAALSPPPPRPLRTEVRRRGLATYIAVLCSPPFKVGPKATTRRLYHQWPRALALSTQGCKPRPNALFPAAVDRPPCPSPQTKTPPLVTTGLRSVGWIALSRCDGNALSDHPAEKAARLALRYPAKPRPAKPSTIMAHVEASGTVLTLTSARRLPCWEAGPLSTNDKKPDALVNVWVKRVYPWLDGRVNAKL